MCSLKFTLIIKSILLILNIEISQLNKTWRFDFNYLTIPDHILQVLSFTILIEFCFPVFTFLYLCIFLQLFLLFFEDPSGSLTIILSWIILIFTVIFISMIIVIFTIKCQYRVILLWVQNYSSHQAAGFHSFKVNIFKHFRPWSAFFDKRISTYRSK